MTITTARMRLPFDSVLPFRSFVHLRRMGFRGRLAADVWVWLSLGAHPLGDVEPVVCHALCGEA
jgi:hypothetical protein